MIVTVGMMKIICFCVFTDNDGSAFTKIIFWGNEVSLQLFLLSFFSLVDLLATDYVLAAILTYILNMVSVKTTKSLFLYCRYHFTT